MSKLIDIEKVKAEIDNRLQMYASIDVKGDMQLETFYGAKISQLKSLLCFLDTLPEEKQEDLEEEITTYINKHYHTRYDETLEKGNDPLTTFDFEDIARHFHNLGLNSKQEDCNKLKGWVARNMDGKLFVHHIKPDKKSSIWLGGHAQRLFGSSLFPEITWKDEEPTEVELIIRKL